MKYYDFTRSGGFPLTQDVLGRMQLSYKELIATLGLLAGPAGKAIIVQGVEPVVIPGTGGAGGTTGTVGGGSYTAGWAYFNGELIKCNASSWTGGIITLGGTSYVPYMVFTTSAAILDFHNGTTQEVVMETTASLQLMASTTPEDATHVKFSNVLRFGPAFGAQNREDWVSGAIATISASNITGTFRYKNDNLNNTVWLQTTTSFNVLFPYSLAAAPADTKVLIAGMGAAYAPGHTHYFHGYASVTNSSGNQIQDDSGAGYIRTINCWVDTLGRIYAELPRPAAGCAAYTFSLQTIIPMD